MDRRQFLAGSGTVAAGLAAGCLGGNQLCTDEDRWPPQPTVESLELAPGRTGEFEIHVDGITAFSFTGEPAACGDQDLPVRFGDVEFSPRPDASADSCPPLLTWDDCTDVTVTVPVHVAPDAEPGAYEYGFSVLEQIDERHSQEYSGSVTVTEA